MIYLREVLSELHHESEEKKALLSVLEDKITLNYKFISQREVQNLARYYKNNGFWLYEYAIKSHHASWKSSAFAILLKEKDYCWKEWALKKYGEK